MDGVHDIFIFRVKIEEKYLYKKRFETNEFEQGNGMM